MISPILSFDASLKFEQKSPKLIPAGPNTVPTGGAGVALPAGISSLIFFTTSLATKTPPIKIFRVMWYRANPHSLPQNYSYINIYNCKKDNTIKFGSTQVKIGNLSIIKIIIQEKKLLVIQL